MPLEPIGRRAGDLLRREVALPGLEVIGYPGPSRLNDVLDHIQQLAGLQRFLGVYTGDEMGHHLRVGVADLGEDRHEAVDLPIVPRLDGGLQRGHQRRAVVPHGQLHQLLIGLGSHGFRVGAELSNQLGDSLVQFARGLPRGVGPRGHDRPAARQHQQSRHQDGTGGVRPERAGMAGPRDQQSPNAAQQASPAGRHRGARRDHVLGQRRQRPRVARAIPAGFHGHVVAAVLALNPNATRDPPDGRVIEQQRLHDALKQVDQVVVPPDVRQLVGQDRLDLLRRQPRRRRDGHEDHRPEPADHHRRGRPDRRQQPHGPADAEMAGQPARRCLEGITRRTGARRSQPLDLAPRGQVPGRQHDHAGQPRRNAPRQGRLHPRAKAFRPCRGRIRRRRGNRRLAPLCRLHGRSSDGRPASTVWDVGHLATPAHVVVAAGDGMFPRRQPADRSRRSRRRRVRHASRRREQDERRDGGRRQQRHGNAGRHVPRVGRSPSKGLQRQPQQRRDGRPLPDEVHQRPADLPGQGLADPKVNRCHRAASRARRSTGGCAPDPRTRRPRPTGPARPACGPNRQRPGSADRAGACAGPARG